MLILLVMLVIIFIKHVACLMESYSVIILITFLHNTWLEFEMLKSFEETF